MLVLGLAGIATLVVAYPPGDFERTLAEFLESFPGWLDPLWGFLYDLLGLWAIVLVVTAVVARRRVMALQAVGSLVLAVVIGLVSARLAIGHWPDLADALRGGSESPVFPAMRLMEAAVVLVSVGPHLVRPLQSVGRWLLVLGFVGSLLIGNAWPSGSLAAILIAFTAAAAVSLAFGTSAGQPDLAEIAAALAEIGVTVEGLEVADGQVAGVVLAHGRDPDGSPLLVKVHGRDAYDNQLVSKAWHAIWYQDTRPALRLGRAALAEHEALVTLLAGNAGVPTRAVVAAATTARDDALLVLRGAARPLAELSSDEVDNGLLEGCWRALALLHAANIAHLHVDPSTVVLIDGQAGLVDFDAATIALRPEQLDADRTRMLVTTATIAGSERALQVAVESLGLDGVTSLLPYLQQAALGRRLRKATKEAGLDVGELRDQAAEAVGVKPPELVKMRRVSAWSLIQAALLVLAASAILSFFTTIDWDEVRSSLASAAWGAVALGFIVAQLPRLTQAVATLGSVAVKLPYGPVYAMQLATCYMNLALPSSVARMAVNIRFFQRQGLSPTTAVSSGVIASFANNVVQAVLLVLLLLFTASSLTLDFSEPSSGSRTLLWIIIGLIAATALVIALSARVRQATIGRVRTWWPDVRTALRSLGTSHKLFQLLGGNLATELLFATSLSLFVIALGYHIPLTQLLVTNISVSLLTSFIPVPGGIGVTEFGLTIGLTSAGMPEEAALATVLLYRIATFYLPPVWGFFALRWLQQHQYL